MEFSLYQIIVTLAIADGTLRQRQELVRSLTITQLESLGDALLDFNKDGGFGGLVRVKFIA